jgi:hypothetical protein
MYIIYEFIIYLKYKCWLFILIYDLCNYKSYNKNIIKLLLMYIIYEFNIYILYKCWLFCN